MSASQNEKKEQKQDSPQPAQQTTRQQDTQRQYQQKQQYPRKQYYRKNYHRGYQGRYNDYQGDKSHARIIVTRDVYRKLVQYVLKYYSTLKGMSSITSELLSKAIDMDIADKENRRRYAQEMHLHSEV